MLTNTQEFRREALFFEKYGHYDCGVKDTIHYVDYWTEQYDRCINGYKVGDTYITGYHYFYLNFWNMMVVEKKKNYKYEIDIGETRRTQGDRTQGFPRFFELDYEYFLAIERAERMGKHILWLKARGCGASYKAASMLGRNFFLIPKSKNFALANNRDYLDKDGILTKFILGRSFVNSSVNGFAKSSDFKDAATDMHWRASVDIPGEGEQGYMSEVIGVSLNNDWQKARGKRGKITLFEEFGKFPNGDKAWEACRDGAEEGDITAGLQVGFGTGGTEDADFKAMETMFYQPDSYNILPFENQWDEGLQGTQCGYFTPAYMNIAFIDKEGNCNREKAKTHYDASREEAKLSPNPMALIQRTAENPYCPQEAILDTSDAKLPSAEAKIWRLKLVAEGLHNLGVPGELHNTGEGIRFRPSEKHPPIHHYPHSKKDDLAGCIVQYQAPMKVHGVIPDNLYIISNDPYGQDKSVDMKSIGATYVYMNPNNVVPGGDKGDRIVATYFGRPDTQDDYNKNLYLLAQYYNAKIGFENDRGDVIGYGKRFNLLDWLEEEFELAYDENLATKRMIRKFGMHIGSGKEDKRKMQGLIYLNDWLLTPRGKDEYGNAILNLHTIYCPVTLQEIEKFRVDGNFDRISSLIILMYYRNELFYKETEIRARKVNAQRRSLFNTQLFQ